MSQDNPRLLPVNRATVFPQSRLAAAGRSRRAIFVNRFFKPDISATSQILTELLRELNCPEVDLVVVCSRQLYSQAEAPLASHEQIGPVDVRRVWSARFGRERLWGRAMDYATFYLTAAVQVWRLARRDDFVIAMTDPPMISIILAPIAKLRGAILINWLQDIFPEAAVALGVLNLRVATAILRCLRNWSLRAAWRNVVISHGMRRRALAMGVPVEQLVVIENWADERSLYPQPKESTSLRRSLMPSDEFVVQYSGNMGRAHDYLTLLEAASALKGEEGWRFLFVGSGANMQRLRKDSERLNLGAFSFRPYQPRELLGDSLSAADVHVSCLLPDLEGLIVPSKFYGILAVGRPVIIIGDVGGDQAKAVLSADCGAVVACGDGVALTTALRKMRSDLAWVAGAGKRARELFDEKYTLTRATRQWRELLYPERVAKSAVRANG